MVIDATVAVAYYPEGKGHATRMVAIANALQQLGATVKLAGGGPGSKFVALQGYDEFEPTTVDYIDTYQRGSLSETLIESVPASTDRIKDYFSWLKQVDPAALVTDDMFAAIAAATTNVPLYVLKHDMPTLYSDPIEKWGAKSHTVFQRWAAKEFFCPTLWPPADGPRERTTRVPPIALCGKTDAKRIADILLVPSYYSDFTQITTVLEQQGNDVVNVSNDEWGPVPSLLPYIRGADIVVCSGYSTIMEAAVAGTPCIIHPVTDEQQAVAERIDETNTAGFAIARNQSDLLEAVRSPPEPPTYENGASQIAEAVLEDLMRVSDDDRSETQNEDRLWSLGGSVTGDLGVSIPTQLTPTLNSR